MVRVFHGFDATSRCHLQGGKRGPVNVLRYVRMESIQDAAKPQKPRIRATKTQGHARGI